MYRRRLRRRRPDHQVAVLADPGIAAQLEHTAKLAAVGFSDGVPFLFADELTSGGATHLPAANFTEQVIVDGRLVTGQNPQSAAAAAKAVVELLCA